MVLVSNMITQNFVKVKEINSKKTNFRSFSCVRETLTLQGTIFMKERK